MTPFIFKTKYFTLEIFRRSIVFSVATLIFASGINLVNGNIFLALISIYNKQLFNEDSNEYGFWVGVILLIISLFLFYIIIINWRIEIYSKTFIQLRKGYEKFGTLINHRIQYDNSKKLRELHTDAYDEYKNTVTFLGENQTLLDIETYNAAVDFNHNIGLKFTEFDTFIKQSELIEKGEDQDYRLDIANRETPDEAKALNEQFILFVNLIKEKEKFKILNNS